MVTVLTTLLLLNECKLLSSVKASGKVKVFPWMHENCSLFSEMENKTDDQIRYELCDML